MVTAESLLRTQKIVYLRGKGFTYRAIGEQFGISKERIRQIVEKHRRIAYWRGIKPYGDGALFRHEAKELMPLVPLLSRIANGG
jgi:hypothetical protein